MKQTHKKALLSAALLAAALAGTFWRKKRHLNRRRKQDGQRRKLSNCQRKGLRSESLQSPGLRQNFRSLREYRKSSLKFLRAG